MMIHHGDLGHDGSDAIINSIKITMMMILLIIIITRIIIIMTTMAWYLVTNERGGKGGVEGRWR